ncbi:MAG: response regulator transcription factor [Solirubrobacteraceae bacterium]|nr:response regulator transcription factor [Solirubrobacteraceae bacterium]
MSDAQVRLLIADDHPLYRSSVERVVRLNARLAVVGLASDGREALDRIIALQPDVAVVDLNMPGLDGLQLLDALSQEDSGTRVVILTGNLDSDQVYRAVELGAAAVLSKLIEPEALVSTLLDVAAGNTVLGGEVQALLAGEVRNRRREDRPVLTDREREVLGQIADGASVAEIAAAIHLSPSTVKSHLESLYRKLEVSDRAAAVATAMRKGLLR